MDGSPSSVKEPSVAKCSLFRRLVVCNGGRHLWSLLFWSVFWRDAFSFSGLLGPPNYVFSFLLDSWFLRLVIFAAEIFDDSADFICVCILQLVGQFSKRVMTVWFSFGWRQNLPSVNQGLFKRLLFAVFKSLHGIAKAAVALLAKPTLLAGLTALQASFCFCVHAKHFFMFFCRCKSVSDKDLRN
jgi:hypothetical protein